MKRASSWLSTDLTALVQAKPRIAAPTRPDGAPVFDFDVVIVGSGYGGAVAAAGLAGRGLSVCVLERGREYLAGSFPSRSSDLAGHVRFAGRDSIRARGEQTGLFDLRLGGDVNVLVANGLGGGSLINAGVMEAPDVAVLHQASPHPQWPAAIRNSADAFLAGADAMRARLGAQVLPQGFAKTQALEQLAGAHPYRLVPITVAGRDGPNSAKVALNACVGCGDCSTGCNHNAKDSLDLNLLRQAWRGGTSIYSGATVLRVLRPLSGSGWEIEVQHTAAVQRARQPEPFRLRAQHVVLAAGTLGSTEILMRSRSQALRFSCRLGEGFSANGDMIAAVHAMDSEVRAVAREDTSIAQRQVGPTITSMIDQRAGVDGMVVQDLAVPAALQRLYEEAFVLADVLTGLAQADTTQHGPRHLRPDPATVQRKDFDRSLVVAVIGHDDAAGQLTGSLAATAPFGDGVLGVTWEALKQDARLGDRQRELERLGQAADAGSRTLANPMWQALPEALGDVLRAPRGPLLTVHPLGGCRMADTAATGVVDHAGRVFDAAAQANQLHAGLYVLDGSIVPTSLGINPALTIALLAERALAVWEADGLIPRPSPTETSAPTAEETRPRFAPAPALDAAVLSRPTQIEVIERLRGRLPRAGEAAGTARLIELTLHFGPTPVATLLHPMSDERVLEVTAGRGRLRIASSSANPGCDEFKPSEIEFEAEVTGSMRLFALERSSPTRRVARALLAWLQHRAVRDHVQKRIEDGNDLPAWSWAGAIARVGKLAKQVSHTANLLSHTGAARLLEYTLRIDRVVTQRAGDWQPLAKPGLVLKGLKRFAYEDESNPWLQLSTLWLTGVPGQADGPGAELRFDTRYAARIGVPLLRVTDQQDRPAALIDLASLAMYVMRVAVQVHALSFRKPDSPGPLPVLGADERLLLPRTVRGLPAPVSTTHSCRPLEPKENARFAALLAAAKLDEACWRLTRYGGQGVVGTTAAPPVLLIHGYSASGTTFAHDAIPKHLVGVLCEAGRDVWVLDMRSSAGMPTARLAWRFEDMAKHDIPRAVEFILKETQAAKVDVVAHCMGSAMFCMALLYKNDDEGRNADDARWSDMHGRVDRVVLSQVGPRLQLSPDNTLRAYVMNYVRAFLPLEDYSFRKQADEATPASNDLLDRLLATLPYPKEEFRLENPQMPLGAYTRWAGTRHRMDALYARTFSLANMPKRVLDQIDDFFGPLSVETASQVIHLAQTNTITDVKGRNYWTAPERLAERFQRPLLMLCGEDNGLVDPATLDHMAEAWFDAGLEHLNRDDPKLRAPLLPQRMLKVIDDHRDTIDKAGRASLLTWLVKGFGHQDCMVGNGAGDIHRVIEAFLRRPEAS